MATTSLQNHEVISIIDHHGSQNSFEPRVPNLWEKLGSLWRFRRHNELVGADSFDAHLARAYSVSDAVSPLFYGTPDLVKLFKPVDKMPYTWIALSVQILNQNAEKVFTHSLNVQVELTQRTPLAQWHFDCAAGEFVVESRPSLLKLPNTPVSIIARTPGLFWQEVVQGMKTVGYLHIFR